jgi:hypothetical protein
MCDYSLQAIASRKAAVADKLISTDFGRGTRGFAGVDDPNTAVCVLPGTEIAFDEPIRRMTVFYGVPSDTSQTVARFRQINKDQERTHHDALELPDGETILLTLLAVGQRATVLQLPAEPKNETEAKEQERLEIVG